MSPVTIRDCHSHQLSSLFVRNCTQFLVVLQCAICCISDGQSSLYTAVNKRGRSLRRQVNEETFKFNRGENVVSFENVTR